MSQLMGGLRKGSRKESIWDFSSTLTHNLLNLEQH